MNSIPQRRWVSLLMGCAATGFGLAAPCPADMFPNNLGSRIFGIRPLHADGDRAGPVELYVQEDRTAVTHRLRIPAAVLAEVAGGGLPATGLASSGATRSVVAGIALAAALGCGFVAYRRGRAARLAMVVICCLAAAGGGGFFAGRVWADIPPGMPTLSPNDVVLVTLREVGPAGKVVVETTPEGLDGIVLVLGTKAAEAN